MAVTDASTSKVPLNHFGIKDPIKDNNLEEIFKMMYKNDLSEPALPSSKIMMSSSELSVELHILEKGTVKKDDH